MLRVYFTAIALMTGINARTEIIGPTPANQAVLVGTDHTLTCRRVDPESTEGSISWNDVTSASPVLIYLNLDKQVPPSDPKYLNFNVDRDNTYDMIITSIAVEDEGTYVCQNTFNPDGAVTVTRTVEVPLNSIDLSQDGNNTDLHVVTVTAGEPSDIVCTGVGARPAVTIDWYHKKVKGLETKITDGVNQIDAPNGDTIDSVSTLTYTATKDYNGGSLRCVTTGQEVATPEEKTASVNVQYIPVVEVNYGGGMVTCKSDGNPAAFTVIIIVNGTDEYSPTCEGSTCTSPLTIDYYTDVRCNAMNAIGTGTAKTIAVPVSECVNNSIDVSAIILGVLLCVSVIFNILLLYRLLWKKSSAAQEEIEQSSAPHLPKTNMEIDQQTSQYESTYEVPETREKVTADTAQAYMDLTPHTRDENTTYQELNSNDKAQQGMGHSANEEIKETKDTQAYVNVQHTKPGQTKRK